MSRQALGRPLLLLILSVLLGAYLVIGWQALAVREYKEQLLRCELHPSRCGPAQHEWLAAQAAGLASGLHSNSEIAELLARTEVLFSASETELPNQRARLKKALYWTDQAIAQRPRWAYAYAARLGVQLKLGDLDAGSDQSWRAAWRLGPNEKRVLQVLAEAVFVYRDAGRALPMPAEPILNALARTDRPGLLELGTRFGGRDMLCRPGAALAADPICQPLPSRSP